MTPPSLKRNFPNFLDGYLDYALDGFCPPHFHMWTGLSLVAGMLERKVWVSRDMGKVTYYPNMYIFLIGPPGLGKSHSMGLGTKLMERICREHDQKFHILPNQMTEAALLRILPERKVHFMMGSVAHFQTPAYYYASEASASLKNFHGDLISMLTEFYDCTEVYRKQLASMGEPAIVTNACMNVIAGTTFDYLKVLVNEQTIQGGFASRVIYVVQKDYIPRDHKWVRDQKHDEKTVSALREKLIHDLLCIHQLKGNVEFSPEVANLWESWEAEYQQNLQKMGSSKLAALSARQPLNLIKLCILLSVCESDEMIIHTRHFEKAKKLLASVAKELPTIISYAQITDRASQIGMNQVVMRAIGKPGDRVNAVSLRRALMKNGNEAKNVDQTLETMEASQMIRSCVTGSLTEVELLVNPDDYL